MRDHGTPTAAPSWPAGSGAEPARIAELVRDRAAVRPNEGFTGAVAAPLSASGETGLR